MEIMTKEMKRVLLVQVVGRLDHITGREFYTKVEQMMNEDENYRVVVDLTHCPYMSSVGLHALLALRKVAKRYNRGDVRIANPQPYVKDTLELVGFLRIFEVFDDVVEAVGSF